MTLLRAIVIVSQPMLSRITRNILILLSLHAGLTLAATAQPAKLGFSGPLSGGGAGWGNDVRNVLVFANEKLAGSRYELVFEDDRCNIKTSLLIAQKLSEIDGIKGVFTVCGQATIASAPHYRRKGIPVMATLATPSRIAKLGIFRSSLNDAWAGMKLARHIAARHKEVYVLTEEDEYAIGFLDDFRKAAQGLNLSVTNESYLAEQQDFRPQLLRFRSKGASALFLNTQTEEKLASLVRQLKELGMSPDLFGAYLPGSANFLKIAGQLAEGLVFVDFPAAEELLTPEGRTLFAEYRGRFGELQGWSYAFPAVFEAFRAMHQALCSGGAVEEYLRKTKFQGIIGQYSFDSNGDIIGPQHVLRVIKNGRSAALE
ncbi:MAG: hypothetical protein DCC75_05020 [Proteobacteria bacterium]|nr:MAG: hypothetical protein DCC75_05020 [Pseudomonadota bacterium]